MKPSGISNTPSSPSPPFATHSLPHILSQSHGLLFHPNLSCVTHYMLINLYPLSSYASRSGRVRKVNTPKTVSALLCFIPIRQGASRLAASRPLQHHQGCSNDFGRTRLRVYTNSDKCEYHHHRYDYYCSVSTCTPSPTPPPNVCNRTGQITCDTRIRRSLHCSAGCSSQWRCWLCKQYEYQWEWL